MAALDLSWPISTHYQKLYTIKQLGNLYLRNKWLWFPVIFTQLLSFFAFKVAFLSSSAVRYLTDSVRYMINFWVFNTMS